MANYLEIIHLHEIKQPGCLVCEASKSLFGVGNPSTWPCRDYRLCFRKMIQVTAFDNQDQNHAGYCIMERIVAMMESIFWNTQGISFYTLIIPDVLHTIYPHILKHLMEWTVPF
jgi:hypothetical protein